MDTAHLYKHVSLNHVEEKCIHYLIHGEKWRLPLARGSSTCAVHIFILHMGYACTHTMHLCLEFPGCLGYGSNNAQTSNGRGGPRGIGYHLSFGQSCLVGGRNPDLLELLSGATSPQCHRNSCGATDSREEKAGSLIIDGTNGCATRLAGDMGK